MIGKKVKFTLEKRDDHNEVVRSHQVIGTIAKLHRKYVKYQKKYVDGYTVEYNNRYYVVAEQACQHL